MNDQNQKLIFCYKINKCLLLTYLNQIVDLLIVKAAVKNAYITKKRHLLTLKD